MIRIGTFKGDKGFWKEVYASGYYGSFTFKIKFEDADKDFEVKNVSSMYCYSNEMEIEVWSNESDLADYDFRLRTYKCQDLI